VSKLLYTLQNALELWPGSYFNHTHLTLKSVYTIVIIITKIKKNPSVTINGFYC